MKRFFACTFAVLMALSATFAQDRKEEWRERVQNEKIAFLTAEMKLSPEEAQQFWPVYNSICEEAEKAQKEVMAAYKKLDEAVKGGKEKEIEKTLKAYISSLEKKVSQNMGKSEELAKVLPVEKVARLYLAEEKFRFQQIHRLHHPDSKGQR